MKTLQEQYNLIKEGKGNKHQFFKSARHLFPDLITPVNTFEDTVRILKNRGIIAEGISGIVTKGKTPDWHAIFKENITEETKKIVNAKQNGDKSYTVEYSDNTTKKIYVSDDAWDKINDKYGKLNESKEAKAEEKETTKEVTDMATRGYDYKDYKNIDNIFGETFLKGFYTEMGDPKNEGKTVEELKQIVAKNLAKDCLHYTKEGQFGLKGVGYTIEAPGLGEPKPAKGKHKSSGYGDLQESVLRSQIYLLAKEILTENTDVLDQYLSVIQANGYTKDEAYSYLEDQVGDLTQQQIDIIINNAFPMKENKKSESEIISALRKKYRSDLKGVNDDEDYKNLPYQAKLKVKDYIRFDLAQEQ